jgi:citrate synthase
MPTKDLREWRTGIAQVVSGEGEEEVLVRGEKLSKLIGQVSFAEMMFLLLQGRRPTPAQARVLDALLVAGMEHGIAPPSMVARLFASYGTNIQSAVGAGILSFGDRMGGLGEQLAKLLSERVAGRELDEAGLRAIADDIVAANPRVPGYGIPLHGADPRAPAVLAVAEREGIAGVYCRLGGLIEAALAERRGGRPVPMNVDGVTAVVGLDLGFDWRATRLFLLTPRSVSMGAHYLEEQAQDSTWRHIPADDITYE